MERLVSRYLRKWLGLPSCTSAANLYSKNSPLPKPLLSAVEEYKAAKCRAVISLRTSKDNKVVEAGEHIRTGRKWNPQTAVDSAISRLKHKDVVGTVCIGRQGLGSYDNTTWSDADERARREKVVKEVREAEEEERMLHLKSLYGEGEWTRWRGTIEKNNSWSEVWNLEEGKLNFILRAVLDLLPSPSNLKRWGKTYDSKCTICNNKGSTLRHILNSCRKSLAEGRYRWRHDQVLKAIANIIDNEIRAYNSRQNVPVKQTIPSVHFVKEGSAASRHTSVEKRYAILSRASDWQLMVDIGRQLRMLTEIVTTTLRPDMVIRSDSTRVVILIELTVPWEDRIDEAHETKASKYVDLVEDIRMNGWQVYYFPVEVGSRGYPAKSFRLMLNSLGLSNQSCRKACKTVGSAAEEGSRWLWLKRAEPWKHGGV